ncbi:hypothetical protein [Caballeronia humi]|uniref:Uncharacterized protein n=1 Tax=Caballeronia humi TaxID=326474 RepID=A0A158H5Y0_9BURK|nr:hypothetical protein [Caballeronia humi]SAL39557.1 hypothetical protein AWB65_02970 [Caballeronia humi]
MFKPFANDTDALNVNGDAFSVTNGMTRIAIAADIEIPRDKTGLTTALALQKAVNAIVDALQKDAALPAKLAEEPAAPTGKTGNPFI